MGTVQSNDTKFGVADWIVDGSGISRGATHTTITSALSDAVSGDVIAIRPGTYTEDLTLKEGVALVAIGFGIFGAQSVIVGKMTMTATGNCTIKNIFLQTNGDNLLVISGANASRVYFDECFFNVTNATGISFTNTNSGSGVFIYRSHGTCASSRVFFTGSGGAGGLYVTYSEIEASGTLVYTSHSAGYLAFRSSYIGFPIQSTSTGSIVGLYTRWNTPAATSIISNSNVTSLLENCAFASTTASTISIGGGGSLALRKALISSSAVSGNAVIGTGTLFYGDVTMYSTATGLAGGLTLSTYTTIP